MTLRKAFCVTHRPEYSLKITSARFVASFAFRAKKKYQSIAQSFAAKMRQILTRDCLTCPFPQEQRCPNSMPRPWVGIDEKAEGIALRITFVQAP
jgi:hypothetical protein